MGVLAKLKVFRDSKSLVGLGFLNTEIVQYRVVLLYYGSEYGITPSGPVWNRLKATSEVCPKFGGSSFSRHCYKPFPFISILLNMAIPLTVA